MEDKSHLGGRKGTTGGNGRVLVGRKKEWGGGKVLEEGGEPGFQGASRFGEVRRKETLVTTAPRTGPDHVLEENIFEARRWSWRLRV